VRVALSDPRRDPAAPTTGLGEALAELTRIIADGIERGELRNDLAPELIARTLATAIAAAAIVEAPGAQPTEADAATSADVLVAISMRGLRADGPSWRT
jgi:hypothetical protein